MKQFLALSIVIIFALQPCLLMAESQSVVGPDTRIHLADGTVVEGNLVEKTDDLIIIRVDHEIFTFELEEVDSIITVSSPDNATVREITVTEFPYISFLGGSVAFSLLSWLQFDRASDREQEAKQNIEYEQLGRAKKLNDQADRARLYGWGSAALATTCLGIALFPRKSTRLVLPEITFRNRSPGLQFTYVHRF